MNVRRVALPASLASDSIAQLRATLQQADQDPAAGAIVLVGKGEVFCRGLELEAVVGGESVSQPVAAEVAVAVRRFAECLLALRQTSKPAIALVDGAALGGGVGLAAACDVVLCSDRARFAFPEVLFGLIPATILPFVLERMAPQTARLWALTAASRSADEARQAGLADEVVESGQLQTACRRWLRQLRRSDPRGVGRLKHFTLQLSALGLEVGVERGVAVTQETVQSEKVLGALRRFAQEGSLPWEEE
jgi:enoyl-CoA hydratase/carnithine racemase